MLNIRCSLFALSLCLASTSPLLAESIPTVSKEVLPAEKQDLEISKVSEAFGHLIGKNIETLGFKFDIVHIVKGLQDAAAGKDSPMTEAECIQAISVAQENAFKNESQNNLKKAEEFLTKNAQEKDVVVAEEGKLHYKIEKVGAGEQVQPHFTPMIRYVGKYVDGSVFGSSKEDELISLDEAIPGLKKGVIGMKEGEKRTLYIHPDLGYGTHGYLPPNSLLTFEVEIVKAHAPQNQEANSLSSALPQKGKSSSEVAAPLEAKEVIR